jgi:hypothetical protein
MVLASEQQGQSAVREFDTSGAHDLGQDVSWRQKRHSMVLSWWHRWHRNASDRTPLSRMFAMVIGSIGSLKREAAIINSGA